MYNYVISLGWYCGTASSMSKYGYRGASGPFDWCHSDFSSVLHFLESEFSDFLVKDNLKPVQGKQLEFEDVKYNIFFPHDISYDFEMEYSMIYEKYFRRINRMRTLMKEGPVLFIRTVRNEEELDYIKDNESYINKVIKKQNPNNDILYLILSSFKISPDFKFPYFLLNDTPHGPRERLRTLFDCNKNLLAYLNDNFNPSNKKDNLIFDLQAEYNALNSRHKVLLGLVTTDYDQIILPEEMSIYGANYSGKLFYDNIKSKCKVKCFIDTSPAQNDYKGIPIIKPMEYTSDNEKIVIIPTYMYDKIRDYLLFTRHVKEENIISLETLLMSKS